MDHYLEDYRLARVNPVGKGAAARFRLKAPMASQYAELQIERTDRPRRIVEEIAWAAAGATARWPSTTSREEGPDLTRVELTTYSEPATPSTGSGRSARPGGCGAGPRGARAPAHDLRGAPGEPLQRATIAGYEPPKAARFGAHTGMDPARAPRQGS